MLFSELARNELPEELMADVECLLNLKIHSPEVKQIPRADKINAYLEREIEEIKAILERADEKKKVEWEELNKLFLKTIG